MCVPLAVADRTIAMLNVYRYGEAAPFSDYEALIIERFGTIVALALDFAASGNCYAPRRTPMS